jgi:hypothetical protein
MGIFISSNKGAQMNFNEYGIDARENNPIFAKVTPLSYKYACRVEAVIAIGKPLAKPKKNTLMIINLKYDDMIVI